VLAIAIGALPGYVRLTRAAALGELPKDYVTASRLAGAGNARLMFNTVLPNCMAPLIVNATLSFPRHPGVAGLGFWAWACRRPRRSGAPCCRPPATTWCARPGW
jgi:dipeptide transport system permease protein